jgi:hypothetical protein
MDANRRLDGVDTRLDSLQEYVLSSRSEMVTSFQLIEQRLTRLEAVMSTIDLRLPPLTRAITDFGQVASSFQRG